jgi:hypothetical protein
MLAGFLLSAGGTLLIMLGYVIVKRLRGSRCSTHTACCDCESPELKLQKEQTIRIDEIMQIINQLNPKKQAVLGIPGDPSEGKGAVLELATMIG